MKIEKYVTRWVEEGIIDHKIGARILAFEAKQGRFGFGNMLIGLAGLSIFLGIAAIIGSNWDAIPALAKIGGHAVINTSIAFAIYRMVCTARDKTVWFDLLVGLLAGLTLTFIALVGQVYQTQEPTWKALTFWIVIVSPFWLALSKNKTVASVWIISFLTTYAFFIFSGPALSVQTRSLMVALLPLAMVAVGECSLLRKMREVAFEQIRQSGYAGIIIITSAAQILWSVNQTLWLGNARGFHFEMSIVYITAMVSILAAVLIVIARYFGKLVAARPEVDAFLVFSVLICAAPFVVPHGNWSIVGACVMMLYWAMCGWVGVKAGYPRALNTAAVFISLRLIVVYVEVFGSLLQTGIGLIISGALLIGLVWGTRRVVAVLGGK